MYRNRWSLARLREGGNYDIEPVKREPAPAPFELTTRPEKLETSQLGSQYYHSDELGVEHYMPVWLDGIHIPYATVTINLQNIIVSTPMTERRGSVHEVVSTDDYVITIRGLLIDQHQEWPEEQVKRLQKLFQKKRDIELRSVKTDLFLRGNDKVLIKSIPLPPSTRGTQEFEIQLISDLVYTLDID